MTPEVCRAAVLAFADIKAAVEDFDRGDSNLFDVLEQIRAAISVLDRDRETGRKAA